MSFLSSVDMNHTKTELETMFFPTENVIPISLAIILNNCRDLYSNEMNTTNHLKI